MIANLNGEFETVDYTENRSMLVYDNVENEEYPLHWHNAVEIIYPVESGFKAIVSGREYNLAQHDILIIPAGELHNLKANPGRRFIFLCNNKTIKENPALSDICSVTATPVHITRDYGNEFYLSQGKLMKDIFNIYSGNDKLPDVHIYIKLITLLSRIREYQLSLSGSEEDGKYADKFRFILKYIDKNYMYDITLDGLAQIAGYSKYHFSRIFKRYSDISFIDAVNQRRIKAAETLLMEAELSVTDAAMQSGFSSLTTFNRVFKEIKGCTPSEFKKLYRGNNIE